MAIHSSILAWRIPWTEEPDGLRPWGRRESHTHTKCVSVNPNLSSFSPLVTLKFVFYIFESTSIL